MAMWLSLLKSLPWSAILANGPAVARAADRAWSQSRVAAERAERTVEEIQGLGDRIAALEANQLELARVTKQMADQTERLALAMDVLAARLRWLTIGVAAGVVLAIVALIGIFR